jgi:hypothetical protein
MTTVIPAFRCIAIPASVHSYPDLLIQIHADLSAIGPYDLDRIVHFMSDGYPD